MTLVENAQILIQNDRKSIENEGEVFVVPTQIKVNKLHCSPWRTFENSCQRLQFANKINWSILGIKIRISNVYGKWTLNCSTWWVRLSDRNLQWLLVKTNGSCTADFENRSKNKCSPWKAEMFTYPRTLFNLMFTLKLKMFTLKNLDAGRFLGMSFKIFYRSRPCSPPR